MDSQKVIFVLLIVTIVLSVGSLLISLGVDVPNTEGQKTIQTNQGDVGVVSLYVEQPPEDGGNNS